ncbi:MAG: glycosyltransferase family protein [Sutterellaceae bacterium]|nr:glycosyltransferase family protein [Burkholderiaceae bacterium]MDW8429550.1 glycosyltransferase family protein [Sutterellaceae bacterium]
MNVLGILQARVSSSRLPGKVLKPLLGEPMIARQIERLRRARMLEALVLATSTDSSDDPLARWAQAAGVPVYRGSLDDVLDRFVCAARPYAPAHVVRLTGDCPLADPAVIDLVVTRHLQGGADYTSNTLEPTWPDGLDVEVMTMAALEAAARESTAQYQREHVTQFIIRQPERFRLQNVRADNDLSGLRWTVDEPADFELVEAIYAALYPSKPAFGTADILAFLRDNPHWMTHNTRHARNEGLARSIAREQQG